MNTPNASETSLSSPSASLNQTHSAVLTRTLWLCVFVMLGLVVMSRSKADPDLWGHVTYGKEVIRDGHLHANTTWSYAVDDFRWVNHENIAELTLATADYYGGQYGLLLVKSVLTLVVLGVPVWVGFRNGAGLLTCLAIVVMLSFNISFHWLVRPHMLSYACGAGLMGLLAIGLPGAVRSRDAQKSFGRSLWLVPPLMCFWTNSHGGYLAGMAILMAWLGLDAIELLLTRDQRFWPTVRHHAILFSATVVACLINPYGLELHTWMLSSLGRPRPEISEWAPLPLFSVDGLPFWGLALTTFLCLKRTDQPVRWPGLIVTALLSWQAVKHHRHLPFVAMMAAFVLAPHIESVVQKLIASFRKRLAEKATGDEGDEASSGWTAAVVPAVLLLTLCVVQYPRQATLHVDKNYYPVSAMQYMADHDLKGNVFVTFNWAQYALAVFSDSSPESRIAFDGRFRTCYPQEVIDMYFDFILGDLPSDIRYREDKSGPFDPTKCLEYKNPNLVLFERSRKNCVETMESVKEDWCLLYQDSLAQLWGRRSVYDDRSLDTFLAPERRHISEDAQGNTVAWPGFPRSRATRSAAASAQSTIR